MHKTMAGFGLLALMFAVTAGSVQPASAEFFGCNDQHRASSYSTRSYSAPARRQYSNQYSQHYAAAPSRHATYAVRRSADRWR